MQRIPSMNVCRRLMVIGMIPFILLFGLLNDANAFQRGGGRAGGGGARMGGGGGGGARMGGGGGGARPSMGNLGGSGARPNMGGMQGGGRPSMPQMPANRPQMPNSRPSFGNAGRPNTPSYNRPSMPGNGGYSRPNPGMQRPAPGAGNNRPSLGLGGANNLPQVNRPNTGNIGTRPGPGNIGNLNPGSRPNVKLPEKPSVNRPQTLPGGGGLTTRPGIGNQRPGGQPGDRPSLGGVNRPAPLPGDLNRPGQGGNRPGIGGDRPGIGGDRPGIGGNRPTPLPGERPGIGGNRPGIGGDRPGTGGDRPGIGNRPNPLPGDRPGIGGNRPGIGGDRPGIGGDRPGIGGDRPGIGDRPITRPPSIGGNRPNRPGDGGGAVTLPGVIDRPGIGGGNGGWNRPDWNNRPGNGNWNNRPGNGNWGNGNWGNGNGNWGNGNWGNGNNIGNWGNNNNINNINVNRPFWDRPIHGGWGNGWGVGGGWNNGWYNHCVNPHYHGWYNGCWSGYWGSSWYAPVAWGAVGWGLGSLSNSYWNTASYVNPYYVAAPIGTTTVASSVPYDYSQPVVVNNYITADSNNEGSSVDVNNTANPTATAEVQQSFSDFDAGLDAFKSGDYKAALDSFNAALRQNSGDPVVHELRALTLFALGDYSNAAIALNSLLAAAPGMDWTTLSSLYGNSDDYTAQLRTLEAFCKANPKNAASAFVLAYHYLVIGSKESAIRALRVVVENQPKDLTAKRMLEALDPSPASSSTATGSTPAAAPTAEELASPQPETNLVGSWQATSGNTTIKLSITEESTFQWKVTEGDKVVAELSGDLATNGDEIALDTKEQGSLGGSVKSLGADAWVMVPPGAKEQQGGGLKFSRVK